MYALQKQANGKGGNDGRLQIHR